MADMQLRVKSRMLEIGPIDGTKKPGELPPGGYRRGEWSRARGAAARAAARRADAQTRARRRTMRARNAVSGYTSIVHKRRRAARTEVRQDRKLLAVDTRMRRVEAFCDHRQFPGLVQPRNEGPAGESVVGIEHRKPSLLSNLNRTMEHTAVSTSHARLNVSLQQSRSTASLAGLSDPRRQCRERDRLTLGRSASAPRTSLRVKMKQPLVRLSRNELLQSVLPDVNFMARFKRLAFEKAHCPPSAKIALFNPAATGKPAYSTAASTDVESLRKEEEKHGRGWVADPYQDPGLYTNMNFRGYEPGYVREDDGARFILRKRASAGDLWHRKQFMTLSSPLETPGV